MIKCVSVYMLNQTIQRVSPAQWEDTSFIWHGRSEARSFLLRSVSLLLLFIPMHTSLLFLSPSPFCPLCPPTTSSLRAHPWEGELELPVLQGWHSLYFSRSHLFPVPVPRALLLSIKSCCHGLHSSRYKGENILWVMQNLRTKPKFYCCFILVDFFFKTERHGKETSSLAENENFVLTTYHKLHWLNDYRL